MGKIPCPNCGELSETYCRLNNGLVSVMCWGKCGMDFDVNGVWFMLNHIEGEEE